MVLTSFSKMSIFYSPDEPKIIDKHTGRMTRLRPQSRSFSREKDNTLFIKNRSYLRNSQTIHECGQLKNLKDAYTTFISMFTEFNRQNGPEIIGNYMSNNFLHFKAAFEPFLNHASHYFNSSEQFNAVRRYSPLLQFSSKVLHDWAILVSTMNKIASSVVLPHLHIFQKNFELLHEDVSIISNSVTNRTYYRDTLYSASNYLKHQITVCYQATYDLFAHESDRGIKKSQLASLKNQIVLLSRDINDNYLGLLPNSATSTPEMSRAKAHMKATCGNIVNLLDAGYVFRKRMDRIQDQMAVFHYALCNLLDRVQVKYEIDVEPLGCQRIEKGPEIPTTTMPSSHPVTDINTLDTENIDVPDPLTEAVAGNGESIDNIVDDIGMMLNINVTSESGTVEKLSTIKKSLQNNNNTELSKSSRLSRVSIPPPISSKRFSKTSLSPRKVKKDT